MTERTQKLPPDMKLRISAELRQKIERAAEQNGRTLNGEIVVRLEESFDIEPETRTLVLSHEQKLNDLMLDSYDIAKRIIALQTQVEELQSALERAKIPLI